MEEIKEVIALIEKLGPEAKSAFVWYLVTTMIPRVVSPTLTFLGVVVMVTIAARTTRYLVVQFQFGNEVASLYGWSGVPGMGTSGRRNLVQRIADDRNQRIARDDGVVDRDAEGNADASA